MDNSFLSVIDSAASILVLLPVKPDFDSVAAGLSLYLSIHDKKEVNISCPSPMMVDFNRIVGVNKITSELGNKNLTIKFKGYDAGNIEKVSYDIIDGEFNLTVIPKTGFIAPQKDQMDLSFNGVNADLIILIGGANDSDFPILTSSELSSSKIAHIGTRIFSSSRDVMSFASPGATTSEIAANLIKGNNMAIDSEVATNLVMGIEDGSNNFSSNEITPDTFETFAWLLRNGGQRQPKTRLDPASFPPGSIPTQPFNQTRVIRPVSQPAVSPNPEPVAEQIEGKEPARNASSIADAGGESLENPPDDWLQPKVFKGTSVS